MILPQPVKPQEDEAHCDKRSGKNADPHQNTGNTLCIQIHKEIRIDQRSGGSGDENRRVELQNNCLDQKKCHVSKGKRGGSEGIVPLGLFALIE